MAYTNNSTKSGARFTKIQRAEVRRMMDESPLIAELTLKVKHQELVIKEYAKTSKEMETKVLHHEGLIPDMIRDNLKMK